MRNSVHPFVLITKLEEGEESDRKYWQVISLLRRTRIDVAIEAYRLDHGQPPESLEALVPGYFAELPADPFSGGPFRVLRGYYGRPPEDIYLGDGETDAYHEAS